MLHNPETNSFILRRDVKWSEWKMTYPSDTMNMFGNSHKEYLAPGIEEYKTLTSEPEDKLPVHIIPDEH